jgi:tetratricopeptide (TPR) repeat protein
MQRTAATTLLLSAALVPAALLLGGCDKLKAREHCHRANNYYKDESFEAALHDFQLCVEKDPTATLVWRSVGFSALALYRPGDESAENKGYGETAVEAFRKYLSAYPADQKVREYLTSILMGSGRQEEAIQLLEEDADKHPGDMNYQNSLIAAMAEAGLLERAMEKADAAHTTDPQIYHAIGVTAWSKSYRSPPADVEKHRQIIEMGIRALEKALQLQGNKPSMETLSYINLLWREKVKVEIDPFKQQEYIKTADGYRNRAIELRRQAKQQSPAAAPSPTASPQGQQGG